MSALVRSFRHNAASRPVCRLGLTRCCSFQSDVSELKPSYDAIVIGAGHNGLVSAAYLAKSGLKVAVFERRHIVGGAAVTEEIIPGYKFSRASYVLSLLRPRIIHDLKLKEHGLKIYIRKSGAFTPVLEDGVNGKPPRYLCLYPDEHRSGDEIAKFSKADAKAFPEYERFILDFATALDPILDSAPPTLNQGLWKAVRTASPLLKSGRRLRNLPSFYEFVTSPITKTLNRWFETDILKATLATDGVIGAMLSPNTPGSSYVLLHHMLGEADGIKGAWGFAEGGMGSVSDAIAKVAKKHGADIFVNQEVKAINVGEDSCEGVTLSNGKSIESKVVLSNATPEVTFRKLLFDDLKSFPGEYLRQLSSIDYTSPVTKINVAVDKIPSFLALSTKKEGHVPDQLKGTIHLNCETVSALHDAYLDAAEFGRFSKRPMIEMCIPSTVDPTLAPRGHHVISLFTQYTPYYLGDGKQWTYNDREKYKNTVFQCIEDYAPGFTNSVIGYEVLTPMDLETTFGLTGGNIFHGALGLDQILLSRPIPYMSSNYTPLKGLYICGSGTHPGGGVMGSCGRLGALAALKDLK